MDKISYVLGLPVLEMETGNQIGAVQEVVLDIEQATVEGIILNHSQHEQDTEIAFQNIYSIGSDAVIVKITAELENADFQSHDTSHHRFSDLCNKKIYTETGLLLGVLVDIFFDNATGELQGFQVSDGIVADMLYGRRMMPLPQAQVIGQDKMIVPDSMMKLIHFLQGSDSV